MSPSLFRTLRPITSISRAATRSVPVTRTFRTSAVQALKESDRHNPNQGEENAKHIQDGIDKQKEGKGHWKPELASDSEEAVAADKHEHSDHSAEGIKELQEKTKDAAKEKHE